MKTINFILSDAGAIIGGSPDGPVWLAEREARLAAENAELRNDGATQGHLLRQLLERLMTHVGETGQSEGALDVLVRVLAERDRLRAEVALYETAIQEAETILGCEYGEHFGPFFDMVEAARKGGAAEWLETEIERRVEVARIDMSENAWYCEECQRWQDRRSPCEADARFDEREKALAEMEAEKAKAGVEGRRQGLAEAAELAEDVLAVMIRDLYAKGSEPK